jgi:putative N6-adenine-specific DNA methylase
LKKIRIVEQKKYIAKTLHGLEQVLSVELEKLGATEIKPGNRAVEFQADTKTMYAINYNIFTAIRILESFSTFTFNTIQEFYEQLRSLRWHEIIDVTQSIAVDASVFSSNPFNNSHFAELKAKDAIVDYFRDTFGIRPSINKVNPDLLVNIFVHGDFCHVSLDTSGTPLYKRGYRVVLHDASINEVLAAGMIRLSGWNKTGYFYDPMCGAGTIPIEAAMYAMNMPSGFFRTHWGFMNWKNYSSDIWKEVTEEYTHEPLSTDTHILASDIASDSIYQARKNIASARMMKTIKLSQSAFSDIKTLSNSGVIIMNPPYNKRLPIEDIISFYQEIGNTLKHSFKGHEAWIISSDVKAIKHVGLKANKKIILYNGPDESRFHQFLCY